MILNKKTCELNDVDFLIKHLYLQTKQAYFKAQTSDVKENMSPKNKGIEKTSLTNSNKEKSDSKFDTINVFDPSYLNTNCEISSAVKGSGMSNNNFNTSSSLIKSVNNDFEILSRDVSIRRNLSSNCEISITKTDFDSKLEAFKLEYSKIRSLSLNCDSAIALHRKLGNSSGTKMVSSKCASKVVVQVLPQIKFGDKFDLLKSGISNRSLGFKPYTFSPTSLMSGFVNHSSDPKPSLSEEECVQNVKTETISKNLNSKKEIFLLNSMETKRVEENNPINDKIMLTETKDAETLIKGESMKNVEAETNSKIKTFDEELVLLDSSEKKRKMIDESYSSINDKNVSSQINHSDTVIRKFLKVERGNIASFRNNGVKLCDIEYIAPKLAVASVAVIRTLHYLLYGSYGLTRNEILICQTVENILQFNGFTFFEESEIFRKKRSLLVNLPSVLYVRIYDILMNHTPKQKQTSLEKLLSFLKQPSDNSQEKEISEREMFYEELKKKALQTQPFVKIEKLDKVLVNVLCQKNLEDIGTTRQKSLASHKNKEALQYKQLKAIPGVPENIQNARRRIINLLHSFLYGRPGSEEINRKNILEFSGFKSHHKNVLSRRLAFLYRLKIKEIEQLCDVLKLQAKSGNKNTKIKKLLNFFSFLEPHQKKNTTNTITADKPTIKLRDFEKIYTNVEFSTPEDLTPLNDLLYVKPCDNSEIHQKILDFSSFTFDITSIDFQYRRTLMHYMDFKTVKLLARILDIEDWEYCTNRCELSLRVLKFLMDMKLPEKKKLRTQQKYRREKTHPHILKFHSSNIERRYCKSKSCTPGLSDRHTQVLSDSTPLLDLMQHPTDKELLSQIDKIINNSSLSITVGGLVKEVLNHYPKFDLHYRIDFIKAKALEVLQELRLSANVFPD